MTKEEILNKWDWSNKPEILEAMDEYAKHVAICFLSWVNVNRYIEFCNDEGVWGYKVWSVWYSYEQLFEKYLCATSSSQ